MANKKWYGNYGISHDGKWWIKILKYNKENELDHYYNGWDLANVTDIDKKIGQMQNNEPVDLYVGDKCIAQNAVLKNYRVDFGEWRWNVVEVGKAEAERIKAERRESEAKRAEEERKASETRRIEAERKASEAKRNEERKEAEQDYNNSPEEVKAKIGLDTYLRAAGFGEAIFETLAGFKVISREEVIIADRIYSLIKNKEAIIYEREYLGKKPDFQIEYNGQKRFWEHLGCWDWNVNNYRKKNLLKLKEYLEKSKDQDLPLLTFPVSNGAERPPLKDSDGNPLEYPDFLEVTKDGALKSFLEKTPEELKKLYEAILRAYED